MESSSHSPPIPMDAQECKKQALSLMHQGRMEEGLQRIQSYVEQHPDDAMLHSMLLFFTHYLPSYDKQALFEGYRQWAFRHAPVRCARPRFRNVPNPQRRLRIGYLSPDFRAHAVAYNAEVLLRERNHDRFEVFGYGSVSQADSTTQHLSTLFDHYRDVYHHSDEQLARLIEQDEIDILVEIAGQVAGHRLQALAYKPAPIQVDYQGINTTGMPQIDYCLTDAFLDPPGAHDDYVEQLIRLPHSVLCYTPPRQYPALGPLPYLTNGRITFGSFNASLKVNTYTVGLWAQVLRQVPDSHLLIKFNSAREDIVQRYQRSFVQAGVEPERLRIVPREPSDWQHLDLYNQVDIGLDSYPFNGCVNTLESLWMGVPVVSLSGDRYVSRMGSTILNNCGLESCVASGPEQFVAKAAALARHPEALAQIRMGLRARMLQSPIGNAAAYARDLEEAYLGMWQQWCHVQTQAMERLRQRPVTHRTHGPYGIMDVHGREPIVSAEQSPLSVEGNAATRYLDQAEQALVQGQHAFVQAILDDHALACIEATAAPDLLFRLAAVFHQLRHLDRAEQYYRQVLAQTPHPLACINLAHLCQFRGQVSEAVALRMQVLDPKNPDPGLLRDLGCSLIFMGDKQAGIDYLRQAVGRAPQDRDIHSSYLFRLHYLPDLSPEQIYAAHRHWAQQHAPLCRARTVHANDPDPERPLRIGYISPDFRSHPVARFFEPLLEGHDRQGFVVYGYGNVACPDDVTLRLQEKFDLYRPVFGRSDQSLAQQIQADQIDILIDLAGHTPGNRLGVLALKPTPVQGSYLGYPDTTGMEQVDFRLVDDLSTPAASQAFYTERLVSLPHGFLCYRPPDQVPEVGPLPALRNGYVTFGAFNDTNKLNESMLACWAATVRAVPGAHLLIKSRAAGDPAWRQYLSQILGRSGLDASRVRIEGQGSTWDYFQLYNQVDIALDTYPYNGTTTMCDALWMGVPVISLVGCHHVSRMGLSILSRVGLEFFAATTPEEYIAKARVLAGKPDAQAKIRSSLRHRLCNSALGNNRDLVRKVESAYQCLWQRWCREKRGIPREPSSPTRQPCGQC